MPHKLLERQHQLQAQKRHEACLRQDYYRRTALYFERESAAARQFQSWSARGRDSHAERLEKSQRAERLSSRREKLRQLLAREKELYEGELEEQRRTRRRTTSETLSLAELRQKLMEKKAEHSLYYPNACRRLRSYAFSPADTARKLESLDIAGARDDNVRPVSKNSQRHIRFSTSPSLERALYNRHYENNNNSNNSNNKNKSNISILSFDHETDSPRSSKMAENDNHTNMRFAARGNHQSLQETNLRSERSVDQCDSSIRALKGGSPILWLGEQHSKPRSDYNEEGNSYQTAHIHDEHNHTHESDDMEAIQEQHDHDSLEGHQQRKAAYEAEALQDRQSSTRSTTGSSETNQQWMEEDELEAEPRHKESVAPDAYVPHTENERSDSGNAEEDSDKHRRGNTRQKEADCAGDADISVQMYRYLKHNDLKRKIADLCKREQTFAVKQCWDEALRLREMRNELILLKNKNLYENRDLRISEDTRQSGLSLIEARETLNNGRVRIRDSTLYSDEARDLWKQWVREDDEISNTETNAMRDLLLQELEDEWQSLALRDKNRISQLYDRVMNRSDLQDEHKLAAIIRDANDSQKQYMNYLAV